MSNTSYSQYVESIAQQFIQLSGQSPRILPLAKPANLSDQARILILAPHPDDECLMAGPALRMMEEWNAQVTVLPFSYGSDVARRKSRALELKEAASVLGFQVVDPRKGSDQGKLSLEEFWDAMKAVDPEIIIAPHAHDDHPTHVEAALMAQAAANLKKIILIQTEYWQAAQAPNLFIPLAAHHVVKIGQALMKHVGEVSRNPYHLSLPGWYMDQARRAPEVLGSGFGSHSSGTVFGQLLTLK